MRRFGGFFLAFILILSMTSTAMAEDSTHSQLETLPGSQEEETTAPERGTVAPGSSESNLGTDYLDYCSELGMKNVAIWLANSLGYALDGIGDETYASMCYAAAVDLGYVSWEDYVKAHHDPETGKVDFTKEFVEAFNLQIVSYIEDSQGWYIAPACSQPVPWCVNHLKYYAPVVSYASELSDAFSDYGFVNVAIYSWNGNGNAIVVTGTNDYVVRDSNYFYSFYDENCEPVCNTLINSNPEAIQYFNKSDDTDPLPTFYNTLRAVPVDVTSVCSGSIGHFFRFSRDTKIFKSVSSLNDYLYGNKSIYIMSDVSSRLESMSISMEQFNYDWTKANEETLKAIVEAINNSKTELNVDMLTEEQLQAAINAAISSRLESISKDISSLNDANSLQNLLIYEKLDQIYKLLLKWYDDPINQELNKTPDVLSFLKEVYAPDETSDDEPANVFQQILQKIDALPDALLSGLDEHLDAALDRFFTENLEPLLRELFVPDQDTLDYTISSMEEKLPFIGSWREFTSFLKSAFSEDLEPVIYFGQSPDMDRFAQEAKDSHTSLYPLGSFGKESPTLPDRDGEDSGHTETETLAFSLNSSDVMDSSDAAQSASVSYLALDEVTEASNYIQPDSSGIVADNLGTKSLRFDFSWYEPYRLDVQKVIAGFLWLYFVWANYRRIPHIIDGTADFLSHEEDSE